MLDDVAPTFVKQVLTALIVKSDKHPKGQAKIGSNESIMGPYKNNKPMGMASQVNLILKEYQQEGFILIAWHSPGVSIQFIRLIDGDGLADRLGIQRYDQQKAEALASLDKGLIDSDIYHRLRPCIETAWNKAASYEGFRPDTKDHLFRAIQGADVVSARKGLIDDIDYRYLSTRIYGSSKILSSHLNGIARMLKASQTDIENELKPDEVLQLYGVVPIAHPVYMSGPMLFRSSDDQLINASFPPAIGLWAEHIVEACSGDINCVTSIENQATFMRYINKEKQANELVLYTGGIPSPACRAIYLLIVAALPSALFRHWGDIDLGGFIILSMMEKIARRDVLGFRMSPNDYQSEDHYGTLKPAELDRLERLSVSTSNRSLISEAIASGLKFEQESFAH